MLVLQIFIALNLFFFEFATLLMLERHLKIKRDAKKYVKNNFKKI